MAVTYTKVRDYAGRYAQVKGKCTYGNGDTSGAVATGLSVIKNLYVSPTTVAAKYITKYAISGGTITFTLTDPLAACSFFYTAEGYF